MKIYAEKQILAFRRFSKCSGVPPQRPSMLAEQPVLYGGNESKCSPSAASESKTGRFTENNIKVFVLNVIYALCWRNLHCTQMGFLDLPPLCTQTCSWSRQRLTSPQVSLSRLLTSPKSSCTPSARHTSCR